MKPAKPPQYRFNRNRGIAKMSDVTDFARFLAKQFGFEITVDGMQIMETIGGVHIKGGMGSGVGTLHPFYVDKEDNGGGGFNYTVEPGTFNSMPPDALTGPMSASGAQHVYLDLSYTLDVIDGYVAGGTLSSVSTSVSGSIRDNPEGPSDSGSYSILLASFVDGEKTAQYIINSLSGGVRDDGTAAGSGYLVHGSVA